MQVLDAGFAFRPESVADPVVIHAGEKAAFAFLASRRQGDGYWYDCGLATFRCREVLQIRHGFPNDEAQPGHPYARLGFDGVGIVEVRDSPWLAEVMAINRVVFPNSGRMFAGVVHHIFPFKEVTLEILWRNFECEIVNRRIEEVTAETLEWVLEP